MAGHIVSEDSSMGFVALAFALAVGGGIIGAVLGTSHRRLCALISIGAGSLLGVTLFIIAPEARLHMQWWQLGLALASGYCTFWLISKYIFHVCPACAASHFDEATTHRFSEIAAAMMLALSIHCIVDGLAMLAGAPGGGESAAQARVVEFSVILAICVHKVPEGLALGALLRGAGLTARAVAGRVAAVEATTLVGGVLGLLVFPNVPEFWKAAVLAHAGGGFLFLAIHAVLGEIIKHHKILVLTCFGGGMALIALLELILRGLR